MWRSLFDRFGGVYILKRFDLSILSVEKFILEVCRCLEFKTIRLEHYECFRSYLRGLECIAFKNI